MAGDLPELSIAQVSDLSGRSERFIRGCLKRGDLVNLEPKNVGVWLNSVIRGRIEKNQLRSKGSINLHSKWD